MRASFLFSCSVRHIHIHLPIVLSSGVLLTATCAKCTAFIVSSCVMSHFRALCRPISPFLYNQTTIGKNMAKNGQGLSVLSSFITRNAAPTIYNSHYDSALQCGNVSLYPRIALLINHGNSSYANISFQIAPSS